MFENILESIKNSVKEISGSGSEDYFRIDLPIEINLHPNSIKSEEVDTLQTDSMSIAYDVKPLFTSWGIYDIQIRYLNTPIIVVADTGDKNVSVSIDINKLEDDGQLEIEWQKADGYRPISLSIDLDESLKITRATIVNGYIDKV